MCARVCVCVRVRVCGRDVVGSEAAPAHSHLAPPIPPSFAAPQYGPIQPAVRTGGRVVVVHVLALVKIAALVVAGALEELLGARVGLCGVFGVVWGVLLGGLGVWGEGMG